HQGTLGRPVHIAVNGFFLLKMQPGRIHIDRQDIAFGLNPQDLVTGGLRSPGGDTELLPQDPVEQGRFAHVGSPHDGNIATPGNVLTNIGRLRISFHTLSSNPSATRASCAASWSARRRLLPLPMVASLKASTSHRT